MITYEWLKKQSWNYIPCIINFLLPASPHDSKPKYRRNITNFIISEIYHISCSSDDDKSNTATITGDRYCTCYEEPGKQLLILYGTEYGFSEELARNLFDRFCDDVCQELSLQPRVLNAKDFEKVDFSREQVLLCVFSTSGDGKPLLS